MRRGHVVRRFAAVAVAAGMASACSLNATLPQEPPSTTSSPSTAARTGDVELKNGYFRLYTGKRWVGFHPPDNFRLGRDTKKGIELQTLTSSSDSKTNIVFAHSEVGSLPTSEELVASLPTTNGQPAARPEIADIGGFDAVAASAPGSGGYTGTLIFVDFDGQIWGITINAPDAATQQQLIDAVRQIKADGGTSPSKSPTSSKPSVKPDSIQTESSGGRYSVTVEGTKLSIVVPGGFTEQSFDTAGLVGIADMTDTGRNINFWIDQNGLSAKESELLKLIRERTPTDNVSEVRSVPNVPKIAGYETAACDVIQKDGKVSRLYVVDLNGVMVQIVINEPSGTGGRFEEMVKTVESAK